MPVIVDTFNVVHVTGVLPPELAGIDVEELARLIERSRYRTEMVTLVCDGSKPESGPKVESGRGIRVRYAGKGRTADEEIAAMVRASSAPRRLVVVSSDREIAREARRRRCRTLTSEEFLTHLTTDCSVGNGVGERGEDSGAPSHVSAGEAGAWAKMFGIEELEIEVGEEDLPVHLREEAKPKRIVREPTETATAAKDADARPKEEPFDPRAFVPGSILAEAEALARGVDEAPTDERDEESATEDPADREGAMDESAPGGSEMGGAHQRLDPLPDSIIEEAKRMLEDESS